MSSITRSSGAGPVGGSTSGRLSSATVLPPARGLSPRRRPSKQRTDRPAEPPGTASAAAGDVEHAAGAVAGVVAEQPEDRGGHLIGPPGPAQRDRAPQALDAVGLSA